MDALIGSLIIAGGLWAGWAVLSNLDQLKENATGGVMLTVISLVLLVAGVSVVGA